MDRRAEITMDSISKTMKVSTLMVLLLNKIPPAPITDAHTHVVKVHEWYIFNSHTNSSRAGL